MTVLALALSYAGFLALCLSMPRHYKDVLQSNAPDRVLRILRIAGWLLLAGVFAAAVAQAGWQVGSVLGIAVLTVGALAVSLLLTYAPRRLTTVALIVLPFAVLSVVGALASV